MDTSPLLDRAALLAPIPGDNPAGTAVPFTVRRDLQQFRIAVEPDPDNPTGPQEAKKADWPGIVRLAQETLTSASKDLEVAARLTEALTQQHGFAGLHAGLSLLCELVEQGWDRLYPPLEDGDVEVRAGPFYWLDDVDRGALFPNTLRAVPILAGEKGHYGLRALQESKAGKGPLTPGEVGALILTTPLEQCEAENTAIEQSRHALSRLVNSLGARLGAAAPSLSGIHQVLEECHGFMEHVLREKRGGPGGGNGPPPPHNGPPTATSRAAAYQQLKQAAAVLRELEPHSPIPYLVQRAVELGSLPFPRLIRALVRDANVISELNRELGIPEEGVPEHAAQSADSS